MQTVTNEALVEKAMITTADLATNGKLNAAQSDKFIDYVVQETVLKDNARVIRFRNETLEIDKIGVGKRMAMPKREAADPGKRRGINTSKVTLSPKEIVVPFEITDNFKEINIEGDDVEDHIIQMMARALANDLEELYALGNSLSPAAVEADIIDGGSSTKYVADKYLGLFDGWWQLADGGHIYDAAGANIGLSVFGGMLRSMPTKFRRNKKDLRFFMNPDLAQLYIEKLSTRATSLGDNAAGGATQTPYGVQIVEVPLLGSKMIVTEHKVLTGTTPVSLKYSPVSDVVVLPAALDDTPTTPFVEDTDYTLDETAGTVTRINGQAIGNGATVKITYSALPQVILTHRLNWIVGIGRDIRIEKDRDIFKGANQYAITAKVSVEFEEDDAIVKGVNIGDSV